MQRERLGMKAAGSSKRFQANMGIDADYSPHFSSTISLFHKSSKDLSFLTVNYKLTDKMFLNLLNRI